MFLADELTDRAGTAGVSFVFKASYDKANRTSAGSFRGPGIEEGLDVLGEVKERFAVPVLSDVHDVYDVEKAAEVLDVIQIPAFLCRQTDLVVAAARSARTVNVKKGQFVSPAETQHIVEKIRDAGGRCWLTERGSSFGHNDLVVDFRGIPVMRGFGVPVVIDATHSVQTPGGNGAVSGGRPEFIETLALAGAAAGADGLFVEVHEAPERAKSDGANALRLDAFSGLVERFRRIREAAA